MSTEPLIPREPREKDQNAPTKMCCSKLGILFGIAAFLIISGAVVGILWGGIFNKILINQLVLTSTSKSYNLWKKTPIPMYLKVHLFNWTNPDEFGTVKPNFVEMGPYVFREIHLKVNEVWNDNDTVTFQQNRTWFYEESMSNGSLSDEITNINAIAASVAYTIRNYGWIVRRMVNAGLVEFGETLVVRKTAKELLFDGYNDTLLTYAKNLNISVIKVPFDKFGWFYPRNGSATYDGTFNMFRGKSNINDLGILSSWNYMNKTTYYDGSCGLVNGTTGELWPPINNNKTVSIFANELCTSLVIPFDTTIEHLGLEGYKYSADASMLDNGTKVPSRACYCNNAECQPSGVLNISTCRFGAPAFISQPHFYLADETYREAITGMEPKKEHAFSITIEPTTGVPLQVAAQLQINILVQPDDAISLFRGVPRTYIPVLWFKQEAALTENFASQLRFLAIVPNLGYITFYGICSIGVLLFFIGVGMCIRRRLRGGHQLLIGKDVSNSTEEINGTT